MKAVVDPETCIGCQLCTEMCPNIFQMNDDGKAEAIVGKLEDDAQERCAEDAASQCPVDAIHVD